MKKVTKIKPNEANSNSIDNDRAVKQKIPFQLQESEGVEERSGKK